MLTITYIYEYLNVLFEADFSYLTGEKVMKIIKPSFSSQELKGFFYSSPLCKMYKTDKISKKQVDPKSMVVGQYPE